MRNVVLVSLLLMMGVSFDANAQVLPDLQLKKNIEPLTKSLDIVNQLKPKSFEFDHMGFKHLNLAKGKKFGFIAEEFSLVLPHLVNERQVSYPFGKNANRSASIPTIDETGLIPLLVAAIKEQQVAISKLRAEIADIKNNIQPKETGK